MIPKRTAPAPLIARVATGGLCGACLCAALGKLLLAGALLGGIGGIVGAFLGYGIRRSLDLHIKDLVVAICEDVVAIGFALFLFRANADTFLRATKQIQKPLIALAASVRPHNTSDSHQRDGNPMATIRGGIIGWYKNRILTRRLS